MAMNLIKRKKTLFNFEPWVRSLFDFIDCVFPLYLVPIYTEMSQIFINYTGHLFDEHGNFVNWWTTKSLDEFKKRTNCFVNQYSKYSLDAGKVKKSILQGAL